MIDQDVMKPLIKFMVGEGNDSLGCQYAALCLGNLVSDPENHEELVKLEDSQRWWNFSRARISVRAATPRSR